jgi:hypothetical protein
MRELEMNAFSQSTGGNGNMSKTKKKHMGERDLSPVSLTRWND